MIPDLDQQYELLTVPAPAPGPADWNDDGFVIKKKLILILKKNHKSVLIVIKNIS
jgi:hypothetical protein